MACKVFFRVRSIEYYNSSLLPKYGKLIQIKPNMVIIESSEV